MNIAELLQRASLAPEPISNGEWATLVFRPDLGSQQEFILGVAAAIKGDSSIHLKWVPSLAKLSQLYGESISSSEASELLQGCEYAIRSSFRHSLDRLDCGSPHLRIIKCGYFSAHDVDHELTTLLRRQASALWVDPSHLEPRMDDDWAYSAVRKALSEIHSLDRLFVPARSVVLGSKSLSIGLDNGKSYGNIVSSRYANFQTVERRVFKSLRQVTLGHRLATRTTQPALFVVLPNAHSTLDSVMSKKSVDLMGEVEEMGLLQFCEPEPDALARHIVEWASL